MLREARAAGQPRRLRRFFFLLTGCCRATGGATSTGSGTASSSPVLLRRTSTSRRATMPPMAATLSSPYTGLPGVSAWSAAGPACATIAAQGSFLPSALRHVLGLLGALVRLLFRLRPLQYAQRV